MLSKVIAWGQDRTAALDTLDAALAGYTVLGIDTNVEYLRLLINDADVRAGRLDTGLIERKMPDFTFRRVGDAELVAAALYAARERGARTAQAAGAGPWQRQRRLAARARRRPGGSAWARPTAASPRWLSQASAGRGHGAGPRRRRAGRTGVLQSSPPPVPC